jgi:hypothetical protein
MNAFYAYLYIDPSRTHPRVSEGEPIYVGKGTKQRAWAHLGRTDRHPFTNRLKSLKKKGIEPIIKFLAQGIDEELAILVEQEAINLYGRKDLGLGPLLNLTDGGEGMANPTESTRQKLRAAVKNASPETIEKWRQGSLRFHQDPAKRARYLEGRKKTFTEEWRQNNAKSQVERFKDPEKKQRLIEGQRRGQNRPEVKAKNIAMITEVHNRPEVKASKSAKMKAYWAKRRAERGTKS